jgi:hypothetical protein
MKADLLTRVAKAAMDANVPDDIQQALLECYDALSHPVIVDVVVAERRITDSTGREEWDTQVAGVFTKTAYANEVADQYNDKDSPWLAGIIRTPVDVPRKIDS